MDNYKNVTKMYKSDKLIEELIKANIITDKLCDKVKARLIIRQTLIEVHNEAVLATVMANNKRKFIEPSFTDM
jgi:hypothetical protein